MKVLVTGVTGQLGYDVAKELEKRHIEYKGFSSKNMNLADADAVRSVIHTYHPDVIIHCGAYTAVDRAEDEYEKYKVIQDKNYVSDFDRLLNETKQIENK